MLQIWPGMGFWPALEESYGVQGECFADLLEESGQRPGAAQYAAGQSEQDGRLRSSLRRFPGTTSGGVDDATEGDRYNEERKQRDKVLPLSDTERLHWRCEEVVQEQEPANGGQQGWEESANESDSHHQ